MSFNLCFALQPAGFLFDKWGFWQQRIQKNAKSIHFSTHIALLLVSWHTYAMPWVLLWGCKHTGIYFYPSWPRRARRGTYLKFSEDLQGECRPHIPHLLPLDCTKRLNQSCPCRTFLLHVPSAEAQASVTIFTYFTVSTQYPGPSTQ